LIKRLFGTNLKILNCFNKKSGWQITEKFKILNGRVSVVLTTGLDMELKEQEPKINE